MGQRNEKPKRAATREGSRQSANEMQKSDDKKAVDYFHGDLYS